MALPLIAIVGRPNVGKSMLFNKIIGRRLSIVEDTPGVTRDRIYGESDWQGRKFTLIDTGGIEMNDDEDALTQLCRQYVHRGQCPRMMNMEKVYGRKQYVNDVAREYGADGIIYQQVKFCDPWAYERLLGSTMLREDYGFPVMSVDRPYNIASSIGQMRTRVQAFVESIEIKKLQGGAR